MTNKSIDDAGWNDIDAPVANGLSNGDGAMNRRFCDGGTKESKHLKRAKAVKVRHPWDCPKDLPVVRSIHKICTGFI
jgi:hypothetical protein